MTGFHCELQSGDLKNILSLGEIALNCESLDHLQHEVLSRIQQTVDAESSVYFDVIDNSLGWQFVNGISFGVPDNAPKTWCDHYQDEDPFTDSLLNHLAAGDKCVITTTDTIRRKDYLRLQFYCDFLKPQSIYHMMVIGLPGDYKPAGLIGLHRGPRASEFSPQDIAKINAAVPYISAAVRKIKLTEMARERQEIIRALSQDMRHGGILILDHNLRPTFCDDTAKHIFQLPKYQGHRANLHSNDFPPPQIIRSCKKLRQEANRTNDSGIDTHVDFEIDHASKKITGSVCAYKTEQGLLNFMVCLKAPAPDLIKPTNLQKYNLSRREIAIAQLIGAGMSNREIAQKLFISVRTVQNHLRSIYYKAHVHNRTSLLSRLIQ